MSSRVLIALQMRCEHRFRMAEESPPSLRARERAAVPRRDHSSNSSTILRPGHSPRRPLCPQTALSLRPLSWTSSRVTNKSHSALEESFRMVSPSLTSGSMNYTKPRRKRERLRIIPMSSSVPPAQSRFFVNPYIPTGITSRLCRSCAELMEITRVVCS